MKHRTREILLPVVLLGLAAAVSACFGGGQPSQTSSAPAPAVASEPPSTAPSGEPASVASTQAPSDNVIVVTATDQNGQFRFDPANLEVKPGQQVTIRIVNNGPSAHDWAIPDLKQETGQLQTGQEKTLTFQAPSKSGEYGIICTIPGHVQLGMAGKLIVR